MELYIEAFFALSIALPHIARCLPESLHQHLDRAVLQLVQRVSSPCTLARGGGGAVEGGVEEAGVDLEDG